MAYTAIGTDQTGWTRVGPNSSGSDFGSYLVASGSTPSAWSTSGIRTLVDVTAPEVETVGGNLLQLAFFGTDAADEKPSGRVHLVTKYPASGTPTGFVATRVAEFDLELGSGAGVASAPITATELAVDTISITNDLSPTPPGIRIFGDVAGGLAVMELDLIGAVYVIVELKKGTAESVGFLWRILA